MTSCPDLKSQPHHHMNARDMDSGLGEGTKVPVSAGDFFLKLAPQSPSPAPTQPPYHPI